MPLAIPVSDTLDSILLNLAQGGMRALTVGGCVRDALMGVEPKDIDVEVYGTTYETLAELLSKFGKTNLVGKSFGVIKLTDPEGNEYDFSIPRRDSKTGVGHKDFTSTFDPTITPKDAAERRDFTFNAMAYDPLSSELHDYFGGVADLNNKVIRATSVAFSEDPLRVLRGMQFAARFGMDLDPATAQMCQSMISDYVEKRPSMMEHYASGGRQEMIEAFLEDRQARIAEFQQENPGVSLQELAKRFPDDSAKRFPEDPEQMFAKDIHSSLALERISEEWMKLATKGKQPGSALGFLVDSGWVQFYPRLEQLLDVPQDEEWHPEGSVSKHTELVMNEAASVADREGLKGDDRAVAVMAAMTHDLAKSFPEHGGTTMLRDKGGKMRWTSHGHEEAGGPMAQELLGSMGIKADVINRVVPLVENHLKHINFKDGISAKEIRRLAKALHPATVRDLVRLIEADHSGRPPLPKGVPEQAQMMLQMAEQSGIADGMLKDKDIVSGKDIADRFYPTRPQGKHIGDAQKAAYQGWLDGKFESPEHAMDYVHTWLRSQPGTLRAEDVQAFYPNQPQGKHIGDALKAARDAELAGTFNDSDTGQQWLNTYMDQQGIAKPVQPPIPDQK